MTPAIDAGTLLPFLLQVLLLVLAAAAIGFVVARQMGLRALDRDRTAHARALEALRDEHVRALDEARRSTEALAGELAHAQGRISALASEAERTRTLAAGFRRHADELEASLREASARHAADTQARRADGL